MIVSKDKSMIYNITMNRDLGIDLDNPSEYGLLMRYFNLKAAFGDVSIIKTKHGYHFIVHGVKSDMDLRYIFGDCPGRLYHSRLRGNDDVMFDVKGKLHSNGISLFKTYSVDEESLLSLPFVSKIPRGYYVAKMGYYKRGNKQKHRKRRGMNGRR